MTHSSTTLDKCSRFYIHAYNELDLAARTIIDAFDRERDTGEDLRHK